MKNCSFLIAFFLKVVAIFAQNSDAPPDAILGKCYAKCFVPDQFEFENASQFAVFDGIDATGIELDTIVVERRSSEFAEPKLENVVVVKDTSQTDEYFWEILQRRILVKKGGFQEWHEVLCSDKVTPSFIQKLVKKLNEHGFNVKAETDFFSAELKDKLSDFQRLNHFQVGSLNVETLKKLGLWE